MKLELQKQLFVTLNKQQKEKYNESKQYNPHFKKLKNREFSFI